MSSSATHKAALSFFGATGGCTLSALVHALQAGHPCRALVRDPAKLLRMLQERGISDSLLTTTSGPSGVTSGLEIIKADVTDLAAVTSTLLFETTNGTTEVADTIICGLGGAPTFQLSLFAPLTTPDPLICYHGTTTILSALSTIRSTSNNTWRQPLLIVIAATGVATTYRDFPLLHLPLFRWMLNVPMEDKRRTHAAVVEAASSSAEKPALVKFVSVRPAMLSDGVDLGLSKVRMGIDDAPEVGYGITRSETGRWMFEELVRRGREAVEGRYGNRVVTLTY